MSTRDRILQTQAPTMSAQDRKAQVGFPSELRAIDDKGLHDQGLPDVNKKRDEDAVQELETQQRQDVRVGKQTPVEISKGGAPVYTESQIRDIEKMSDEDLLRAGGKPEASPTDQARAQVASKDFDATREDEQQSRENYEAEQAAIKEAKREKRNRLMAAISDGIYSLSNLYFAGKSGLSATRRPGTTLSDKLQKRYDYLLEQRQRLREEYARQQYRQLQEKNRHEEAMRKAQAQEDYNEGRIQNQRDRNETYGRYVDNRHEDAQERNANQSRGNDIRESHYSAMEEIQRKNNNARNANQREANRIKEKSVDNRHSGGRSAGSGSGRSASSAGHSTYRGVTKTKTQL